MLEKNKDMEVNVRRHLKPSSTINKKKIRKKKIISINFRNLVPKIVDYLKCDSYFYSQVISSSVPFDSSTSHNVFISSRGKTLLGKKGKAKEKIIDYLRADTYLYAPLEGTQQRDEPMVKSTISFPRGKELQFTMVNGTVFSENITWQTKKVAEESINEKHKEHHSSISVVKNVDSPQTPGLKDVKKQAIRRSNRLSTYSG